MIRHIVTTTRTDHTRYQDTLDDIALPKVWIKPTKSVAEFYRSNDLRR